MTAVARRFALVALIGAGTVAATIPGFAQTRTPSAHLRGEIVSLQGDVLTVRGTTGETKVTLQPNASVRAVRKATLADITPGTSVGVAAVPQPDGTLKALEVHITPKGERPPPEGSTSWDLAPNSSMTNARVTHVESATVSGVENRTVTLSYDGGQKQIVVPANVPIVTYAPGDRSLLVPAARVVVFGQTGSDGFLGRTIVVGKDGIDPPM
jgi:hypothetical protein